jgi:ABC-type branched-subunit amino acid transport system substrate-binding protein
MRVNFKLLIPVLFAFVTACAPAAPSATPTPSVPQRIALLAPFEGQYRDIGYDALYAARLALADAGVGYIELMPQDDGGTLETASARALAFATDPQVIAALALGYAAVDPGTQFGFADVPVIIVGDWGTQPVGPNTYILGWGNTGFPDDSLFYPSTRLNLQDAMPLTFTSTAAPPDADFIARYAAIDQFAPPPTPLATLTYDAVRFLIQALTNASTREAVVTGIEATRYTGINGDIHFRAHSWMGAPRREYRVENGQLIPP